LIVELEEFHFSKRGGLKEEIEWFRHEVLGNKTLH
jgi:hypothetical protein